MTTFHPVGTCKMGKDVLDARLKMRSVDRLRVADASAVPTISSGKTNAPAIMIGEKMRRVHSGGSGVIVEHRTYMFRPGAVDTWLAKYEAEGLPIQKRHLNTFLGIYLSGRLHNGADDVGLREPRRSYGAPWCDVRRPRLARVHRRDLDAQGRSRAGPDDHEPGALFTGGRHGAGLTPAPLRFVFRRAPIGARHNAGRVR
jgi:hypothetical protein